MIIIQFYRWNNWDGNIAEGYAVVTQHYMTMELPSNPVLRLRVLLLVGMQPSLS